MLAGTELTGMQNTLQASLPDTCSIRRASVLPDLMGGQDETWTDIATGVACRVSPHIRSRAEEGIIGGAVRASADWTVTLPKGQDVTERDRIVSGGRTFEVKQVVRRSWELCRRVHCTEVT